MIDLLEVFFYSANRQTKWDMNGGWNSHYSCTAGSVAHAHPCSADSIPWKQHLKFLRSQSMVRVYQRSCMESYHVLRIKSSSLVVQEEAVYLYNTTTQPKAAFKGYSWSDEETKKSIISLSRKTAAECHNLWSIKIKCSLKASTGPGLSLFCSQSITCLYCHLND